MKFCVLLLGILSLMISTCVGQTKMTKHDFPAHGLAVILPHEADFASGLTSLGFSAAPEPTAVIVKNTSPHNVAALAVEFIGTSADGASLPMGAFAYLSPASMLDAGNPGRRMQAPVLGLYAGAFVLIGVGGPFYPKGHIASSFSVIPRSPVIDMQVKIDSVVFDNGDAWGPDDRLVARKLREHIRAQQDLAQEIAPRLATESLHSVLEDLSSKQPTNQDFRRGMHSTDLPTVYQSVRASYLRQLTAMYAHSGEEAAMRLLGDITFIVRPTIQLRGEN